MPQELPDELSYSSSLPFYRKLLIIKKMFALTINLWPSEAQRPVRHMILDLRSSEFRASSRQHLFVHPIKRIMLTSALAPEADLAECICGRQRRSGMGRVHRLPIVHGRGAASVTPRAADGHWSRLSPPTDLPGKCFEVFIGGSRWKIQERLFRENMKIGSTMWSIPDWENWPSELKDNENDENTKQMGMASKHSRYLSPSEMKRNILLKQKHTTLYQAED